MPKESNNKKMIVDIAFGDLLEAYCAVNNIIVGERLMSRKAIHKIRAALDVLAKHLNANLQVEFFGNDIIPTALKANSLSKIVDKHIIRT